MSIKEWPLLCDLSDRLLPSIKCQSDCVESQSLFFKTDAKLLSEVPDHPKSQTRAESSLASTGTAALVTVAIKPDLAAQIQVECPCLFESGRKWETNLNSCSVHLQDISLHHISFSWCFYTKHNKCNQSWSYTHSKQQECCKHISS